MTQSGGAQVRARSAIDEPLGRLNFRERVSTSLWFVPALFVLGSWILSKVSVAIDRSRDLDESRSWFFGSLSPHSADSLTATVATAMLTFLGVVFSTTLVAIQLAGGQYSPRVVRIFVRSRLTHFTLGVFLATFVFALNGLVELRGDGSYIPVVTVSMTYVLLLATLLMFIGFFHGMSRVLRVQYLLAKVSEDGRQTFGRAFPTGDVWQMAAAAPAGDATHVRNDGKVGTIQSIDRAELVEHLAARGCWLELSVGVGEFLGLGTPIGTVHGPNPLTGPEIASHFLLGGERTLIQDPGFVIRQLVDVAIRSLSPAVNDPTTAVQSVDRIVDLLSTVAGSPDPTGWYLDRAGDVRLYCREAGVAMLLRLGFVEIIRYGADSPQVTRRLRAAFHVLDGLVRDDLHPVIDELRTILEDTEAVLMPAAFHAIAAEPDRIGLG